MILEMAMRHGPWAYDGEGAKRLFVESETLTGIRDE
jgi:hypothetical protein